MQWTVHRFGPEGDEFPDRFKEEQKEYGQTHIGEDHHVRSRRGFEAEGGPSKIYLSDKNQDGRKDIDGNTVQVKH